MIIKTIGIMTGNSLDAADAVLSVFDDDGGVCDLAAFSLPYPPALRERFLRLKENIKYYVSMAETAADPLFAATVEAYTRLVAETVNRLLETSGADKREIAVLLIEVQSKSDFGGRRQRTLYAAGGRSAAVGRFDRYSGDLRLSLRRSDERRRGSAAGAFAQPPHCPYDAKQRL